MSEVGVVSKGEPVSLTFLCCTPILMEPVMLISSAERLAGLVYESTLSERNEKPLLAVTNACCCRSNAWRCCAKLEVLSCWPSCQAEHASKLKI
eukprot:20461-Heterococcus_DN1.PRE.2